MDNVDCIIKLGGSIITKKTDFETINADALRAASNLLCGLKEKFIVVHGAGSFGHFQASEFNVASGYKHLTNQERRRTQDGFCKTRLSVTKLNHLIVEALVDKGIPAVGVSPCGRWQTKGPRDVGVADCEGVARLLGEGFVPVLHGDCVLDSALGCTVLSGDTIIRELCALFRPPRVVFLSDVAGIYTRPPAEPGARLIPRITVDAEPALTRTAAEEVIPTAAAADTATEAPLEGIAMAAKTKGIPMATAAEDIAISEAMKGIATATTVEGITTTSLAHDVSGGMAGKLACARAIVRAGRGATRVVVCRLGSSAAEAACSGRDMGSEGFHGTVIQLRGQDT